MHNPPENEGPSTLRADPPPPPAQPRVVHVEASLRPVAAELPSTQRLRDLWLRDIDAAEGPALVAIAAELGLQPNSSDAWSERIRLVAYVQQLLRQRGESITYAEGQQRLQPGADGPRRTVQVSDAWAKRHRLRSLWLREIDAASGDALSAIGREVGAPDRVGDGTDAAYRQALHAKVQELLDAGAEETPADRHTLTGDRMRKAMVDDVLAEADPPGVEEIDRELDAMRECALALETLTAPERERVVGWLIVKYGAAGIAPARIAGNAP